LHEKPFFLSGPEEEEALLVRSLDVFEKVLGLRPLGSRAPSCDPSRHTMGLLRKHGFVYHSNLMDADLPYCHATPHGDLVELPTAWCNNDWVYFGFSAVPPVGNGVWSQEEVFDIWREEFEGAYEEGGFFNLMGHPQVIGRPSRMRMLERLIQHILGKKDVWIAPPLAVAEHYLSQR
jgi:peptidoglycan/xylan/chitin deacetylase (PgdA/CDA1 family)